MKQLTILSYETSCDETAVSVLSLNKISETKISFEIKAEKIASQFHIHTPYGGVVPELAAREHLAALPLLTEDALNQGKISKDDITHIAVTRGPGLKGSLLAGDGFAIALSKAWNKPIIPVNHLEGHLYSPLLNTTEDQFNLQFPFLALIVSGGHTELNLVSGIDDVQTLSKTIDDAAGEAFDKAAQLLGLGMPGGPKIGGLAAGVIKSRFSLPEVMKGQQNFSFSGLKTAVSNLIKKYETEISNEAVQKEISYTIQSAIVRSLEEKVTTAVNETGIKKLLVSGGVSANNFLRERLKSIKNLEILFPKLSHTGDNATMIGLAGGIREIFNCQHSYNKEIKAVWRLGQ